ncbi:hypothetical protein AB1Y20_019243 [Prymnesium parvum]|uniref:Uncharacterized protein n=1 Tax=Prymnesium parvum TaxID=97485 RepID=A0AB34JRT7_PRYPA
MESRCLRTTCTRKILFQSGLTITLWPALLLWSCFRLWTWRCMLGLLTQGILVIIVGDGRSIDNIVCLACDLNVRVIMSCLHSALRVPKLLMQPTYLCLLQADCFRE